ncbi:MAG: dihydroxyacetone kinase subunit DhaK [Ancalomicrobiaceae bacterium]|nr:dihydroxyacetone kinase subunit DhaK [Ancalomicrobiaceae bacterium]
MQHFVNDTDMIVSEAIDGFIRSAGGGRLARLAGDPSIKVVIRTDADRSKVALVSGGGSGHEPSHAGFVGRGMLTAAVCGEIFASPSVEAVLAAIRAVTGPAGCLLIVKNYNGDRLNFGFAAEKARAEGLQVEMVIVADDIAIADAPRPRGVAGTLFVHKLAGHAAEVGKDLAAVKAIAEAAAARIQSLGIAISTCKIPGREMHDRLPEGQAELGLGIHGEPGIERIELPAAAEIARIMSARFRPLEAAHVPVAMILNNLGGVPNLEMAVLTNDVLGSGVGRQTELLVGPAPLMTALDMRGFSISVIPLDHDTRNALLAPTEAPAWPAVREPGDVPTISAGPVGAAAFDPSDDPDARRAITTVAKAVIAAEAELNRLDARIGDGDTGTTMASAARTIIGALDALPLADPSTLARAIADRMALVMGGSSGVLLSIFAAAVGHRLGEGASLAVAFAGGLDRVEHYGGAREGDRTMLDAFRPAVRAMHEGGFAAAALAARAGAERTATMTKSRAGRSSYLSSADLSGVPDPGAVAVAIAFEALAKGWAAPE